MPTGNLPTSGRKLFEQVYSDALNGSCKKDKGCAAATAWSVVKKKWKKVNGKWVRKSEAVQEFSMYITKATSDGKSMRWAAVNSDTDFDSYEERMSVELYEDFIGHILNKEGVPSIFKSAVCSEYWCGGMPYVSVSHYPDLNGQAVPGEPTELFIDGDRLKAKGVLYNTPLGHSVFRSLQDDKNKKPEDRIRISIGFLDLAHKHGDNGRVWVRDSVTSVCQECLDGIGNKIYVKGYLVHLALTRVPVNKRTEMVLEEKSMTEKSKKKTRKEDAASIVGASLAEEIDAKNKVQALRVDALVEMSESEQPTEEETQELIAEVEGQAPEAAVENPEASVVLDSMTEAEKKCMKEDGSVDEECMKKMKDKNPESMKSESEEEVDLEMKSDNSGYLVSDRGDGQPALPTKKNGKPDHRLMGAAWAALHGGYRGNKYEGKGKQEAIAKLKKMYEAEGMQVPTKSDAEVDKDMGADMPMTYMPYGGATSMKDAQKAKDAQDEMVHVMDLWGMFSNVAWNIIDSMDVTDKKAAFVKALDEFKGMLAAKAMVEFSSTVERSETVELEEQPAHELKPALDALLTAVDNSVVLEGDINQKLQSVQPTLQELGTAITDYVSQKSVAKENPAPDKNNDTLLENIKQLIQPLQNSVSALENKLGVFEAKSNAQQVNVKPRIPAPKTLSSSTVQKSVTETKPVTSATPKLRAIVEKSVGMNR